MAIAAELTKSIEKSLDSKPVYAFAGAGDLAVEKLRELSGRLTALYGVRVEPKDVQEAVRELPDQAQSVVSLVVATAADVYGDLAERGETVVNRIRRQKSTAELRNQAQSTVRRAKATKTTATKGATATRRAAKGTATSATKTAQSAGRAASDAADKIG